MSSLTQNRIQKLYEYNITGIVLEKFFPKISNYFVFIFLFVSVIKNFFTLLITVLFVHDNNITIIISKNFSQFTL